MLCALLIFRTPELPAPLSTLSPWLDMNTRPLDAVLADLDAQTHRRFIKTHTPLDGLPWDERVTYVHVARDPRDVALSWDNHMANMDLAAFTAIRVEAVGADDLAELGITGPPPPPPDDPAERFWQWLEGNPDDDTPFGLEMLAQHAATFWARRDEPNVHLFHYGDLRRDLAGQLTRLAELLGEDPPDEWLVAAATFEAMKARADELTPNTDTPFWRSTERFFDRGRPGEWRRFLTDDTAERRYEKALAARVPQDLADWLHHGWLALPGTPIAK